MEMSFPVLLLGRKTRTFWLRSPSRRASPDPRYSHSRSTASSGRMSIGGEIAWTERWKQGVGKDVQEWKMGEGKRKIQIYNLRM